MECPHCKARLKIPKEVIGKMVRCPRCKQEFTASDSVSVSEQSTAMPLDLGAAPVKFPPVVPYKKPSTVAKLNHKAPPYIGVRVLGLLYEIIGAICLIVGIIVLGHTLVQITTTPLFDKEVPSEIFRASRSGSNWAGFISGGLFIMIGIVQIGMVRCVFVSVI